MILKRRMLPCLTALLLMAAGVLAESWSTWLPYWKQQEALFEARELSNTMEAFVAFEAMFDDKGNIIVPEETEELLEELSDSGREVYLSLVNDIRQKDGSYAQKSKDFLQKTYASERNIDTHVVKILNLADRYKPDGIEIDYENIRKDTSLWEDHAQMISRLQEGLRQRGMKLRVVVEWMAGSVAELPEGPEYVVMCYNLYGSHSGPGPKADAQFLSQCAEASRGLPGAVNMAFAGGGFEWVNGKVSRQLTQLEAEAALEVRGVICERDGDSGALKGIFSENGQTHEIWYADGETLAIWRDVMKDAGYTRFSLWSLAGNDVENLRNTCLKP